jgi:NADH oxidase (H2O2-forming)
MPKVIAVIGNGIAGFEAAYAARKTDPEARVVLLTKEPYPLYSACVLTDYIAGQIPKKKVFLRTTESYTQKGIELLLSTQVLDWNPQRRMLLLEDEELSYDRLIMATGSRPLIPSIPGIEKEGVLTLKTFQDADFMRTAKGKAAVVIGSGLVGIEAAGAFCRRGWSVSIIEIMDRILPRLFDTPLTEALTNRLVARGIQVRVKEKVAEILGEKHVGSVRTDQRTVPADIVVLVTGMIPEVTLAKQGGLAIGPVGGIRVNKYMHTSIEGIWACGDCAESEDLVTGRKGLFMRWDNARLQGRVAGANAAGASKRYPGSLNITTVNCFQEAAASIGMLASEHSHRKVETLHQKRSWGEVFLVLRNSHLVGVQVLGQTERVGSLVGIMLRSSDLRKILMRGPAPPGGREVWALKEIQRDVFQLTEARNSDL